MLNIAIDTCLRKFSGNLNIHLFKNVDWIKKFEDTKGVIRSNNTKKDILYKAKKINNI